MLGTLWGTAIGELQRGLAHASRRHDLLTQNVANLETPGYKARDLVFEDQLTPSLAVAPDVGLVPLESPPPGSRSRLVFSRDGANNANDNDVDLDRQMARLAENTLFHQALVQILAGQFSALKQAISGRV